MGFLGRIARGAGRLVGRGVEKIGDFFGSEKISNAGRKLQEVCAEKVASERSYDKTTANIYTTDRLNEILVAFSEGYYQQAMSIEKQSIKLIEDYYDNLIGIIECTSDDSHSSADIRILKSSKGRVANKITGAISNPLSKRMSLDDSECLKILKMDSGAAKKNAMTKFSKKIISEALDNLAKNVRVTLNEQTSDIQEYLNGISENQEKTMKALKEQFDKMVANNELEQKDKEKNCVLPLYIIDATDCVSQVLK